MRRRGDEERKPQRDLFDPVTAGKARDAAIAQVGANNPTLRDQALAVIRRLAPLQPTLTTDDIWRELGEHTKGEPRALGAAMQAAEAARLIEPTDQYTPSDRVACHRRPIRVWRSRQYGVLHRGAALAR